ncbi:hypothetical protein [Streptomyces sp. NPDC051014]|uniref:hypothetical protein n=1 Tax=Streptomyces sp. NPDC051014 TaxID=3155751 RepID=UPI003408905F
MPCAEHHLPTRPDPPQAPVLAGVGDGLLVAGAGVALLRHGRGPCQPHPWDHRVKCETKDPDDRKIVARYGNSEFGWKHFRGPHNIKKCSTLYAALHGEVDRKSEQGRKLEYDAVEFETGVPRTPALVVRVGRDRWGGAVAGVPPWDRGQVNGGH